MRGRVNVCMSKIMRMPTKVGVGTYATYANCQTLHQQWWRLCAFYVYTGLPKKILDTSLNFKTFIMDNQSQFFLSLVCSRCTHNLVKISSMIL